MNPKKLSVLLASLTPLLVLIIVFIATGPWQQPVAQPAVTRQIDPAPYLTYLQARRNSYETIETYLRRTYESGILPAGHEVEIDLLYWPYSSTDPIKNHFYTQGVPQEVYDAIVNIPTEYRLFLSGNTSRPQYFTKVTIYPEFTLIEVIYGHPFYYAYFPEDTDMARKDFLDLLPSLSHYGDNVRVFHMEDNWYAALS